MNDVSQRSKHDLQKILAWFIIDYFKHNIDLIGDARRHFRPQNNTDETVIHEQSDYFWDPDWTHPLFINFPDFYFKSNNRYNIYSQRLYKNYTINN